MRRYFAKALSISIFLIIAAIIYFSLSKVYPFNWAVIARYFRLFVDGILMTLKISGFSLGLSLAIGMLIALARVSRIEFFNELGTLYVWFFRNMPLLVIILLVYYGIGSVLNIDRFLAGVISLSLFEGAYVAEIFRAGMEAVPPGEIEAGAALGFYNYQIMGSIILPQAFRISIPPLIGQLISLVKDSSLVSVIALGDITMRARQIGTQTLATLEAYLVLAGIYLLITSTLSILGRYLERRLAIP
ncbi:polar amino acid ABC transporter permease [Kosmotoga arenicorallina S304]|uniref:Polar amino acid ABC transporter permease n=1 Tax=Kosmotoga arenicorallina S304 TaxID=1453497 RepID=A0A182C866_9BACT|nr:amino acid ABC transporter permease [Kosmotoga arenicorallina]OAA31634.1 polar amino acid ABC transporter permease [Kosmotoga arenicorallina S304]